MVLMRLAANGADCRAVPVAAAMSTMAAHNQAGRSPSGALEGDDAKADSIEGGVLIGATLES